MSRRGSFSESGTEHDFRVYWQELCKLLRRGDPNLTDMEAPAQESFQFKRLWCLRRQVQALFDALDKDKDGRLHAGCKVLKRPSFGRRYIDPHIAGRECGI